MTGKILWVVSGSQENHQSLLQSLSLSLCFTSKKESNRLLCILSGFLSALSVIPSHKQLISALLSTCPRKDCKVYFLLQKMARPFELLRPTCSQSKSSSQQHHYQVFSDDLGSTFHIKELCAHLLTVTRNISFKQGQGGRSYCEFGRSSALSRNSS